MKNATSSLECSMQAANLLWHHHQGSSLAYHIMCASSRQIGVSYWPEPCGDSLSKVLTKSS